MDEMVFELDHVFLVLDPDPYKTTLFHQKIQIWAKWGYDFTINTYSKFTPRFRRLCVDI